jgi:hypothetical protein
VTSSDADAVVELDRNPAVKQAVKGKGPGVRQGGSVVLEMLVRC